MNKIGDFYISKKTKSILVIAQVDYGRVAAIGLEEGNRFFDPVDVVDMNDIPDEQLAGIVPVGYRKMSKVSFEELVALAQAYVDARKE